MDSEFLSSARNKKKERTCQCAIQFHTEDIPGAAYGCKVS